MGGGVRADKITWYEGHVGWWTEDGHVSKNALRLLWNESKAFREFLYSLDDIMPLLDHYEPEIDGAAEYDLDNDPEWGAEEEHQAEIWGQLTHHFESQADRLLVAMDRWEAEHPFAKYWNRLQNWLDSRWLRKNT